MRKRQSVVYSDDIENALAANARLNKINREPDDLTKLVAATTAVCMVLVGGSRLIDPMLKKAFQYLYGLYANAKPGSAMSITYWLYNRIPAIAYWQYALNHNAPQLAGCIKWGNQHNYFPWDVKHTFTTVVGRAKQSYSLSDCYRAIADTYVSNQASLEHYSDIPSISGESLKSIWYRLQQKIPTTISLDAINQQLASLAPTATMLDYQNAIFQSIRKVEESTGSVIENLKLQSVTLEQLWSATGNYLSEYKVGIAVMLIISASLYFIIKKRLTPKPTSQYIDIDSVTAKHDIDCIAQDLNKTASDAEQSKAKFRFTLAGKLLSLGCFFLYLQYRTTESPTFENFAIFQIGIFFLLGFLSQFALEKAMTKLSNYAEPKLHIRLASDISSIAEQYGIDMSVKAMDRGDIASNSVTIAFKSRTTPNAVSKLVAMVSRPNRLDQRYYHIDHVHGVLTILPGFCQHAELIKNVACSLSALHQYNLMKKELTLLAQKVGAVSDYQLDYDDEIDVEVPSFRVVIHVTELVGELTALDHLSACFPGATIEQDGPAYTVTNINMLDQTAVDNFIYQEKQAIDRRNKDEELRRAANYVPQVIVGSHRPTLTQQKKMRASVRPVTTEVDVSAGQTRQADYPDQFTWVDTRGEAHVATRIPGQTATAAGGVPRYISCLLREGQVGDAAALAWFQRYALHPGPIGNTLRGVRGNLGMDGVRRRARSTEAQASFEVRPGSDSGFGHMRALTHSEGLNIPVDQDAEARRVVVEMMDGWVRNTAAFHG